jgi:hypothetical protein
MKILGLTSVIALIASLIYIQMKWGPDYTKTFSRLVARNRSSIIYYFVVFLVFLSTFSIFMVTNFIPHFNLPGLFTGIYFLGVISQFVCITVPETGGRKTKIHLLAAGVMSASTLLQIAILPFLTRLSLMSLIICTLGSSIMLLIWLALALKHRLVKYELGLQSIYFASYLGAIVLVGYIG